MSHIDRKIHGRGGGGGGSSAPTPRPPKEAPNTLQSKAVGRILFAIGEGNNVGLANGEQSIYLNGTPLSQPNGVRNFPGVSWHMRTGTPDQDYIPDFPAVESEHAEGLPARVKSGDQNAIVRRVDNLEANAVRVSVGVPSIFKQDVTTGDTNGSRVDFRIRVAGATHTNDYTFAIEGKQMGPYSESIRLPLHGTGPWDISVVRGNPESSTANEQNTLEWQSWTEIVDRKLNYARTGLMGMLFDAQYFGNQIPQMAFDWMGMIVQVPDNYDAVNRTYLSDFWSGNWKLSWTDDPVWLWRHIALHYAGANLHESQVDKWSLYTISRYASERVPDGFGAFEPRFSANFCLNTREEAYAVLNALASCLRAMTYWSSGAVTMVADMPTDPDVIVTPTNTIGGFEYAGASVSARHTVALVSYLDKDRNYEPSLESVEDSEGINRFGWNPVEVTAFACTSRGQAHRLGKWLLDTEQHESEGLTYKASIDHMDVSPGMVAAVADPEYQGIRAGGRIRDVTNAGLVWPDAPFEFLAGESYSLMLTLPNGTVEERPLVNDPGLHNGFIISPPFSILPEIDAVWAITATNLEPRQFRILGISRDNDTEFSISALYHDPLKFARVELGIEFEAPPFTVLPNVGVVEPPGQIEVSREYVSTPGGFVEALQIRWEKSPNAFVRGYVVMFQKDFGGWTTRPETSATNDTLYGSGPGWYQFYVYAVNFAGVRSNPSILEVRILNESPITLLRPTGLELEGQGNNTVFNGRDPKFVWRATAIRGAYPMGQEPAAGAGFLDHIFRDFEIRIFDVAGRLIFTDHTVETYYTFTFAKNSQTAGGPHRAFKFVVLMRDVWGNLSRPAELEVANPAPAAPTGLSALGGFGSVFVSFNRPTDPDYEASLIYMSATSGTPPGPATLVYDGPDTYKYIPTERNVDRFIIVASYDSFGKSQLNYSGEIRVTTSGAEPPDFVAPAVPVGVAATSYAFTAPDGATTYRMRVEWTPNTEKDLLGYTVEIRQEGGQPVPFPADAPGLEVVVDAGETYYVAVRAGDTNSNWSLYSLEVQHTVIGDNIPPEAPTGLVSTNTFRSVWLKWDQHPATDYKHMEVWEATIADRASATLIGMAPGNTFIREGIPTGEWRHFWIRAVDRSGNVSEWHPASPTASVTGRPRPTEEADYQELSVTNLIVADGAIDTAKVSELDAKVLKAGTTMSGSILVDNKYTIGAALDAAGDPVGKINAGSTTIDPGKILIAGGTTLANWRSGPDATRIWGGAISANSVRAESLSIGNRQVELVGITFEAFPDWGSAGEVHWNAGHIIWQGENGWHNSQGIRAGGVGRNIAQGHILYLCWTPGLDYINFTYDPNIYADPNYIVIGQYHGGTGLIMTFGRTRIDGDLIRTRAIVAAHIASHQIQAHHVTVSGALITAQAQIGEGLINRAHIGHAQIDDAHINNLSVNKLRGGLINAEYIQIGNSSPGWGTISIESRFNYRQMRFIDANGIYRVVFGQAGAGPNIVTDGLYVRDMNGKDILTANGLGVQIAGEHQLHANSVVNIHYFPGTVEFGYWSAPNTQNIANRTLFTARFTRPNGGSTRFRFKVNNEPWYEWDNIEGFPPNTFYNVPSGVWCVISVQIWAAVDYSGTPGWVPYNHKLGGVDPVWSVHEYAKTFWTVLEVKR